MLKTFFDNPLTVILMWRRREKLKISFCRAVEVIVVRLYRHQGKQLYSVSEITFTIQVSGNAIIKVSGTITLEDSSGALPDPNTANPSLKSQLVHLIPDEQF